MNEFVYLYRRPPSPPASPQEMQERLARWRAWFDKLDRGGNLAERGLPLDNAGGAVVRDTKGRSTDGPYAETKDIVIGFSVVRANDLAHAIALTEGYPGFLEGGVVEVRPILKL